MLLLNGYSLGVRVTKYNGLGRPPRHHPQVINVLQRKRLGMHTQIRGTPLARAVGLSPPHTRDQAVTGPLSDLLRRSLEFAH